MVEKSCVDNKCQIDNGNKNLKIRIIGQAETTVPLHVGDRLKPPTDIRACVSQTEDEIEGPVVPNEILEKNNGDVKGIVELAASDCKTVK